MGGRDIRLTAQREQRRPAATVAALPDQFPTDAPTQHQAHFHATLPEFADVFADDPCLLPTRSVRHEIRLTDSRPYLYSLEKRRLIDKQVKEMLATGVNEPTTSPYASPVVIVVKKNGQQRFCVDSGRLNAVTADEPANLPVIANTLRDLGNAAVFSTLDLRSRYWQVPLADAARPSPPFPSPPEGATNSRSCLSGSTLPRRFSG